MRLLATGACLLIAGAAAAQEPVPIRPDEAVLACNARAGHEIRNRHGLEARPVARFSTTRHDSGWHVEGVYLAGLGETERRIDVTCDVTPGGVAMSTTLRPE